MLVLIGGVAGFFLGRSSAPEKTLTVTKTVEVPVYKSAMLTDTSEVFLYDVPLSDSLQRYIYEICADEGVPVTMVLAMIEHESGFNPEVVSSTDDYGLMQINAINHERLEDKYRCANMTDPYQNIFCGVSIIGSYLERYEGDYTKALMAYNMGDYGARKAWDSGITSTRYSERILSLMAKYEEVSNAKSD
jgi:soluble lytic murein transglycosylase-like protein